jgi:tetratricopeptide (TPR) repeat protein
MAESKFSKVREAAEQLLAQAPDHIPTLNNLSLALFQEGASDEAVARGKRVPELDPDNCHALSNLTRFLLLTGHAAEAQGHAERLKSATKERVGLWVKKAEALSRLGDDEGVEICQVHQMPRIGDDCPVRWRGQSLHEASAPCQTTFECQHVLTPGIRLQIPLTPDSRQRKVSRKGAEVAKAASSSAFFALLREPFVLESTGVADEMPKLPRA